ncbi:phosphotransferase family protein [Metabacillus lacus]|uniref:phosphotransferase family protein n=1 Tax=Metabacillus lacus TaxID=1983721 RepID=UPI001479406A|nr:phosphotransferase [Metabacillus lacus]
MNIQYTIEKNFPGIIIKSVSKLGEGKMSRVYSINEHWAFRFAKNEQSSRDLEKEINMLPYLQTMLSVSIPQFDFKGVQENELNFVGYVMLPGMLLQENSISSMAERKKQLLIASLTKFMADMQSVPVTFARSKGVPVVKLKSVFTELYEKVKTKVFPLISKEIKEYISMRFHEYLTTEEYHACEPKLIHGDLSPNHFLIDNKSGSLTGVIDFGDMSICDPDYEYLYILEDCGSSFTLDLLKARGHVHPKKSLKKISLLVTFDQLFYVIEGVEKGKNEWVKEGLDEIRVEMSGS